MNIYESTDKKMEHWLIFSRETFYATIVLCLNILWLKAVNEITANQTRTSLSKHDVIKLCSIDYLTTQIELVSPTFKSWAVHKIIQYLTLRLLCSLWNISDMTTASFFDPPCTETWKHGTEGAETKASKGVEAGRGTNSVYFTDCIGTYATLGR